MADLVFAGIAWAYNPAAPGNPVGDGSARLDSGVDLTAATVMVVSHQGFVLNGAAWEVADVSVQVALVEPGDELDYGAARFTVDGPAVDRGFDTTFPVTWAGGLAQLNPSLHPMVATRGPGQVPVTWATLDELKLILGLADSDTSSDELLTLELAAVNAWAFTQRAQTGRYPNDDPTVAPSDAVTLGVLNYTVRQLRDRGFAAARAAGGAEGFDVPTMASVMSLLGLGGSVVVA